MVIKLDQPERFAASSFDIEAMGGDILEVPQSSNSVAVLGRVVNPTSFVMQESKDVDYYLSQEYSTVAALFGQGFFSELVEPGDAIVVPQRYDQTPIMRTVKDITTIMSQMAITAGVVLLGLR